MMCPFCRNGETKVIDSRASQDFVIRRRRECLICERRFTTYEKIEESPLKVIKKDGTRVPFDREKIRAGLEKACYKRPVSESQIEAIVCDVEADVYQNFDRESLPAMSGKRSSTACERSTRSPSSGSRRSTASLRTSTTLSKSWNRCYGPTGTNPNRLGQ